jgi:hypothetical protein
MSCQRARMRAGALDFGVDLGDREAALVVDRQLFRRVEDLGV